MEFLLALGAALSYGVSDFGGGILSRKAHVFVVFLLSQLVSLALLIPVVLLWASVFSWPGIGWGLGAGLAGVVGTSSLYQGLAIGRMSVVAPIAGILGAGLPVLFGLLVGERPGPVALVGIALGFAAVVVITRAPDSTAADGSARNAATARSSRLPLGYAFAAGIGFGLFFILLERSPVDSGLWPVLGIRISLVAVLSLVVITRRLSVHPPAAMGWGLVGLGIVNTAADLLYLLATRNGLLSLVAIITSMYPAFTVGLAALVTREPITRPQLGGLAIAVAAFALIAL